MKTAMAWLCILCLCSALSGQDGDDMRTSAKGVRCDLKKVEKAPFCETCEKIDPEVDEEKLCTRCGEEPTKADVCVKQYFECGKCGTKLTEDKTHCKESKNKKTVVKALIVFRCEGCGESGDADGDDCWDEECQEQGKKVRKTCEQSGTWPHGGKAPAK